MADDNWEIFTVNATGGRSVNLTRSLSCHEVDPAWSNDGGRIAFVCSTSLVVMGYDRRGRRTVVQGRRVGDPAWSPDDRRLAFAGRQGIWVVNEDGTGLRRLRRGNDFTPTWSRDGRTIVFSRVVRGVSHVMRMRADGSGIRRLASRASRPALSPDGLTIAFLRGDGAVWLMDANGGRQRRLSRAGLGNADLAWSPDGGYLVCQLQYHELYVVPLEGTGSRHLRTYGADFTGLDWGPSPS